MFADLSTQELEQFDQFFPEFEVVVKQIGIEDPKAYYEVVFSTAIWINRQRNLTSNNVWVQGIAGGQGSGKSTFAMLLGLVFERLFSLRVFALSLDDFYLTRAGRQLLAEKVSPLLATRGVPGTHEIKLMNQVVNDITENKSVDVPRFDKAVDDREPDLEHVDAGIDVLIVEGWCLGVKGYDETPEAQSQLRNPINALERDEDAECIWRSYVNNQISSGGYQALFQSFNALAYLAVPGWDAVLRWRSLQESRLIEAQSQDQVTDKASNPTSNPTSDKIMDSSAIERFIMFYERITRKMLIEMPATAELVFNLNNDHEFVSMRDNTAPG